MAYEGNQNNGARMSMLAFNEITVNDDNILLDRSPDIGKSHDLRIISAVKNNIVIPPYDPSIRQPDDPKRKNEPVGYTDTWAVMEVQNLYVRTPEFRDFQDRGYKYKRIQYITRPSDASPSLYTTPTMMLAMRVGYQVWAHKQLLAKYGKGLKGMPEAWLHLDEDGYLRKPAKRPFCQALQYTANNELMVNVKGEPEPRLRLVLFPSNMLQQMKAEGTSPIALKNPTKPYTIDNLKSDKDFWSENGHILQWFTQQSGQKKTYLAGSGDVVTIPAADMAGLFQPWDQLFKFRTTAEHIELLIHLYGKELVAYGLGDNRNPYRDKLPDDVLALVDNVERFNGDLKDTSSTATTVPVSVPVAPKPTVQAPVVRSYAAPKPADNIVLPPMAEKPVEQVNVAPAAVVQAVVVQAPVVQPEVAKQAPAANDFANSLGANSVPAVATVNVQPVPLAEVAKPPAVKSAADILAKYRK